MFDEVRKQVAVRRTRGKLEGVFQAALYCVMLCCLVLPCVCFPFARQHGGESSTSHCENLLHSLFQLEVRPSVFWNTLGWSPARNCRFFITGRILERAPSPLLRVCGRKVMPDAGARQQNGAYANPLLPLPPNSVRVSVFLATGSGFRSRSRVVVLQDSCLRVYF